MSIITKINSLSDVPTFEVEKEQLFDSRGVAVPGQFGIMRTDTREHFGTCREKYRPIQIEEMLDIVDTATKALSYIEHIGYAFIGNGKRVIIQSRITDDVMIEDNDKIHGIVYTIIHNTGMSSNVLIPSTIRAVCTNILHLLTKDNSGTSLRHSNTFDENVLGFSNALRRNVNSVIRFRDVVDKFRALSYTRDDMSKLVTTLMPTPKKDKSPSTRLLSKREKLVDLFKNGEGNEGTTRWDALNAITEYESHQKYTPEKFARNMSTNTISSKAMRILQVV